MYCIQCGTQFIEGARFCANCGWSPKPKGQRLEQIEDELKLVLPMATPFTAIIAGYLGLLSLLLIPAPFAVIFGVVGLVQIQRRERSYGKVRCWVGILLGGAGTLLLGWVILQSMI